MRKMWFAVATLAIVGLVTGALAQEQEKKRRGGKLEKVTGTFVSATVEGGNVQLKISTDDGEKTYEMPATVVAICREKNGQKLARMIRVSRGRKAPQAKGNMQVVQGDIQSAALQGNKVVVTIKPAEGEATSVALTSNVSVLCAAEEEGSRRPPELLKPPENPLIRLGALPLPGGRFSSPKTPNEPGERLPQSLVALPAGEAKRRPAFSHSPTPR